MRPRAGIKVEGSSAMFRRRPCQLQLHHQLHERLSAAPVATPKLDRG
ncbi:MAG: hypothetical protein M3O15_11135 [Acidobacteriota bacterium]|nr:hypothetical protein [Acidobacteriota bacterium]